MSRVEDKPAGMRTGRAPAGGTLAQEAYQCLRIDIINGVFAPSLPLRLDALKQRYGLGFSPLREALNRLEAEKLVVSSALKGFRVAGVSLEEMWDAISTRVLVDVEGLRKAIALGDDTWEGTIVAAFHALSRSVERASSGDRAWTPEQGEELEDRHRDFHASLISACRSKWLMDFSTQLYAETERYRRPALSPEAGQGTRDIAAEHRAIMEATLDRDADAASRLLSEHFLRTGRMIEDHMLDRSKPSTPPARD